MASEGFNPGSGMRSQRLPRKHNAGTLRIPVEVIFLPLFGSPATK